MTKCEPLENVMHNVCATGTCYNNICNLHLRLVMLILSHGPSIEVHVCGMDTFQFIQKSYISLYLLVVVLRISLEEFVLSRFAKFANFH